MEQHQEPFRFMGVAESESGPQGPSGTIKGESVRIPTMTRVSERPLTEYEAAKMDARVIAEEVHDGYIYRATGEQRSVWISPS